MTLPDSVLQLAQALVRIPSVNPDGDPGVAATGEGECAAFVADFLRGSGAVASLEEVLPGRPNVIGHFPSLAAADGRPKPRILFAPHTDTVSVLGMTIDPFAARVEDGKLWGRGASDTKGPMAAMLWALYEQRHLIPSLPYEIHFAGFMSEESNQFGSRHFAENHPPYHLALVGEPTRLETVHTHKGCLWATVHTHGRAVHAARPELGDNAISRMARIVAGLDTEFRAQIAELSRGNQRLGPSTLSFGMIRGGSRFNIVADHCTLNVDLRSTPELEEYGGIHHLLKDFIYKIDPTATLEDAPPVLALNTDPEHPVIRVLQRTGSVLAGAPWFCDAVFLAAAGTPAVAIGPGSIDQAHTKDEFIAVEDLQAGSVFFQKFLANLASV
jgi:acetylornithine deacetylase/succinyl-diaminopimelate desuccinylase-like protein